MVEAGPIDRVVAWFKGGALVSVDKVIFYAGPG